MPIFRMRRPITVRRPSGRRPRHDGFTLIEVTIAMFISLVGIGAVAALFVNGNQSSLAAQNQLSLQSALQQQIENVRGVVAHFGFAGLALTSAPAAGSNTNVAGAYTDPNHFVQSTGTGCPCYLIENNFDNGTEGLVSTSPSSGEPLLINGSGGVTAGRIAPVQCADLSSGTNYAVPCATNVPSGDDWATVYTYVTQTTIAGCNSSGLGSGCGNDVRRVILAVVPDSNKTGRLNVGPTAPRYSMTTFANPVASNQPNAPNGLEILGQIP
jgi:prepilin-type N-terminal cleavage/methylation domain-containing protein